MIDRGAEYLKLELYTTLCLGVHPLDSDSEFGFLLTRSVNLGKPLHLCLSLVTSMKLVLLHHSHFSIVSVQ